MDIFKGFKVLLIYWSKERIAQPQGIQGKNKGVTETDNSSMVGRGGFEPPKSVTTDLQSVPFGRSGIFPYIFKCCVMVGLRGLEPRTNRL